MTEWIKCDKSCVSILCLWICGSNGEFKGFPHVSKQQNQCCSADVWFLPPVAKSCDVICTTCVTTCSICGPSVKHRLWIICLQRVSTFPWLVWLQQGFLWLSYPLSKSQEFDRFSLLRLFHWINGTQGGAALIKRLQSCHYTICDCTWIAAVDVVCKNVKSATYLARWFCSKYRYLRLENTVVLFFKSCFRSI